MVALQLMLSFVPIPIALRALSQQRGFVLADLALPFLLRAQFYNHTRSLSQYSSIHLTTSNLTKQII